MWGRAQTKVKEPTVEDRRRLETLVAIMDRLRGEDGCPWDREQTYRSLRGYLLEEAYEALEALDGVEQDAGKALCEELGDLLLQIVFLSRLAKEQGRFTVDDVIEGINDKMIRRHPHIFGSESAENSAEVLDTWERIKRQEKGERRGSLLDGLPAALPALVRAQRLGTKAARVGFDWESADQVVEKVDEELAELKAARTPEHRAEELGDTIFALVQLARKLDIDPEAALEGANRKFRRRFGEVETRLAADGTAIDAAGFERLEHLWREAKRDER